MRTLKIQQEGPVCVHVKDPTGGTGVCMLKIQQEGPVCVHVKDPTRGTGV